MNLHYLFVYGSNLNPARLRERAPKWNGEYTIAFLKGYELRFNMFAAKQRVGANIVPHPTRRVPGIVVQLTNDDLLAMDGFEGHPHWYNRVQVTPEVDKLGQIRTYTYVAQPVWLMDGLLPTAEYLEHIIAGAKACQFPEAYICAIETLGKTWVS